MKEGMVFAELSKILESMPGDKREIIVEREETVAPGCLSFVLRSTVKDKVGNNTFVVTPQFLFFANMEADKWLLRQLRERASEVWEKWEELKCQAEADRLVEEADRIVAEQEKDGTEYITMYDLREGLISGEWAVVEKEGEVGLEKKAKKGSTDED